MLDPNVEAVREKLKKRAEVGLAKYGTDTTRQDLSFLDWLRHAQEEAMDLAVYLERMINDLETGNTLSAVAKEVREALSHLHGSTASTVPLRRPNL